MSSARATELAREAFPGAQGDPLWISLAQSHIGRVLHGYEVSRSGRGVAAFGHRVTIRAGDAGTLLRQPKTTKQTVVGKIPRALPPRTGHVMSRNHPLIKSNEPNRGDNRRRILRSHLPRFRTLAFGVGVSGVSTITRNVRWRGTSSAADRMIEMSKLSELRRGQCDTRPQPQG
jgi:hypothetical protein